MPGLWPGERGFLGGEASPMGLGRKREEAPPWVLHPLFHPFSVGTIARRSCNASAICPGLDPLYCPTQGRCDRHIQLLLECFK